MKQCPECKQSYNDETLNYCLDDGTRLVYKSGGEESPTAIFTAADRVGEQQTEILSIGESISVQPGVASGITRPVDKLDGSISNLQSPSMAGGIDSTTGTSFSKSPWLIIFFLILIPAGGFFAYRYFTSNKQITSIAIDAPKLARKLYWQLTEAEQLAFIRERAQHIQTLISDEPTEFDEEALRAIKVEIDDYVEEKDSLSQKPFEEGLRVIYGRASQYAPVVIRAYEARRVPATLGIYQAMVESEYHDCLISPNGSVGLFQFTRKTAAEYDLMPKDYCNVEKQSDAAARLMSNLSSDFAGGGSSATLGLFGFIIGEDKVRGYLRQLRFKEVTERSFWAVFRHQQNLQPPLTAAGKEYVPRFFASAIIGESPEVFELSTPPLSTLRERGK